MGLVTQAPEGYGDFCRREPGQCPQAAAAVLPRNAELVDLSDASKTAVAMTPALWKQLDDVNLSLNERIRYEPNMVQFGTDDYWTAAVDAGDCKDIALAKRQALASQGWPADSLKMAVVYSPASGQHAVLIVSTTTGDYVLDNRASFVLPWQETGYTWEEAQDETGNWRVAGSDAHAVFVALSVASRSGLPVATPIQAPPAATPIQTASLTNAALFPQ